MSNTITIKDPNGNIVCSVESVTSIDKNSKDKIIKWIKKLPDIVYGIDYKYINPQSNIDCEMTRPMKNDVETYFDFLLKYACIEEDKISDWTKECIYIGEIDPYILYEFNGKVYALDHECGYKYKGKNETTEVSNAVDIDKRCVWKDMDNFMKYIDDILKRYK